MTLSWYKRESERELTMKVRESESMLPAETACHATKVSGANANKVHAPTQSTIGVVSALPTELCHLELPRRPLREVVASA